MYDHERGRCPRRVRRKRLLIFTIMQRARSGSTSARRTPKERTRAAWPTRRTRLSHDIYFAKCLSCAKPLESSCRRCWGSFRGNLRPHGTFLSFFFEPPLSSDMHMHAVTINIFIARGMGRTRGIQRGRFAAPKTCNMYLYECLLLNGC